MMEYYSQHPLFKCHLLDNASVVKLMAPHLREEGVDAITLYKKLDMVSVIINL